MFVDNEVGAAAATGLGEEVLKTLGSFLIVELMRQGINPRQACEEAVLRIAKDKSTIDFQVAFIAMNKNGEVGAYSIKKGFNYTVHTDQNNQVFKSGSHLNY